MSFNTDVGVMIMTSSPQGKRGGVLIKELHDSHVGRACNDCNGSTNVYHGEKTSA